jgi:hypothetical protein
MHDRQRQEHRARKGTGGERPTYILCPRTPGELGLFEIDEPSLSRRRGGLRYERDLHAGVGA